MERVCTKWCYVCLFVVVWQFTSVGAETLSVSLNTDEGETKIYLEEVALNRSTTYRVTADTQRPLGYRRLEFITKEGIRDKCTHICGVVRSPRCVDEKELYITMFPGNSKARVFLCKHLPGEEWCEYSPNMMVSAFYQNSTATEEAYRMELDIYLKCGVVKEPYNKQWNKENENRKYRSRVEGIVVGCCLALIFLCVLGVMYCYYRARPTDGPPEENVMVSAFTGIREKLKPNKKRSKRGSRRSNRSGSIPPSRRPSQVSTKSGISPTYEAARKLSEPKTELKPPEMEMSIAGNGCVAVNDHHSEANHSETKPLCKDIP